MTEVLENISREIIPSYLDRFVGGSYKDSWTLTQINDLGYGHVPFGGQGKSGKTMNAHGMIELCPDLRNRPKAFYGLPDVSIFPADYQAYAVSDLDQIDPGSIAFIDDIARLFPSRDSRDTTLQRFMGLISHKDILIISTVQSYKNADQCLFRDQVVVPMVKTFSPFGVYFEREEFTLYAKAANALIPDFEALSGIDRHMLVFSPLCPEVLAIDAPSWYGRVHSHSLRNAKILEGKNRG